MRILLGAIALLLALAPAAAQEKKKYKILYITQSKGFVHGSVKRKAPDQLAPSEVSLTEIGKESGLFDVECTQDASILTPEKLKELDVVGFYTTGNLPITPEHFGAFTEWLKGGKAMIAFHAATDTYHNFKPYYELINGTFAGHPWGSGETVTLAIHDPAHPVVKMLGNEFVIKDEIYQYRNYDPGAVRVLYSLDMAKCKTKAPYHVPVCWVREVGQGRLFYTNLGHNEGTWQNPKVKEHLLAGIRWALKLEQGSAAPNPEAQALENVRSFLAVAASEAGKPYDELSAKAAKLPGDAVAGLNAQIAALRKIDAKKEPEKRKAELERILAEIEKK
jgi:hypothetical protein